jgi:hypothetical protein
VPLILYMLSNHPVLCALIAGPILVLIVYYGSLDEGCE